MKTTHSKSCSLTSVLAALCCVFYFTCNFAAAQNLSWQKWAYAATTDRLRATLGCDGELLSNKSTTVDGDGNLIVTGCYPTNPVSTAQDSNFGSMLTVKFSGSTGAELWRKSFVESSQGGKVNQGVAVAVDGMGDVLVAGRRNGKFGLTKLRGTSGDELWTSAEPEVNATLESIALALAVDQNNDVVVTGIGSTTFGSQAAAPTMLTMKLKGGTGAIIWSSQLPEQEEAGSVGRAIALTALGDALITGTDNGSGSPVLFVTRLSALNGSQVWLYRYHGKFFLRVFSCCIN